MSTRTLLIVEVIEAAVLAVLAILVLMLYLQVKPVPTEEEET